ncbi:DUF1109 domain-containing protein [Bradyrhizobium sp. INPA01-394B]|uniref:DUF1109 domain-containing protein n=1 Tax=Bradyrhizobium campsiandrae TaxID=1729892 RepID=A0ABR7UEA7_9BRAD|nr:DUF1109 domain-containing protein [Bradyrhizobium campsiandrae]MBC9881020.1 DUF1109 domain-containing protein [Bradyrhizobium campsiandrae]MBC9981936.1 DUF1109 domain-containing protein [Bradyrhizobium campsiandrae]
MKTDEFINTLASDLRPQHSLHWVLLCGLLCGALLAALAFAVFLGFRSDILSALTSIRFLFKFVVTLTLAITATYATLNLARPDSAGNHRSWSLLLTPVILVGAVAVELMVLPSRSWEDNLVGHNATHCLTVIPLLSAGPLLCIFAALRRGAPSEPGLTGAVAGLAASGIGATFYAANCTDDSPLFVVAWYPLAVLIVAGVAYFIGARALRW